MKLSENSRTPFRTPVLVANKTNGLPSSQKRKISPLVTAVPEAGIELAQPMVTGFKILSGLIHHGGVS